MYLTREEKEKLVLDLYYNKGGTYRQIAKELRMSPNQISDIIKKHEEKNNAIANKKKQLSLSTKAYKMFSKGKTNVEVAIKMDIPESQATQFRLEYWKLKGLDNLESLYVMTKGKVSSLWNLYQELVVKRGMSFEEVAKIVDTALNRLPYVESHYEQAKKAADRQQDRVDYLENRKRCLKNEISDLEEEEKKRMFALPYYYHDGNREANPRSGPLPLQYSPSALPDLSTQYGNIQDESKEKEEIHEMYEGDISE